MPPRLCFHPQPPETRPALDGLPAVLRDRRVLPDLRHRRRPGALTSRACPPSGRVGRVADPRVHLQFEALLTAARQSANRNDFALVAMLGLLGLRIFEATCADIDDLGEEHGRRVLRVCGKGGRVVLVPLPPAVGRAIDRAVSGRNAGPILLNNRGTRIDRHAATRRLRLLAGTAGVQIARTHPHMLRHTVTTMLDAGVDLRDVQIAARHSDPRTAMRYDRARKNLDRHPNYILAAYMAPFCSPAHRGRRGGQRRTERSLCVPPRSTMHAAARAGSSGRADEGRRKAGTTART